MTKAKIGRPRSKKSREAILNAAHELLNEKGGAGISIESIARRAGVGKPTIYRWWPSLADIVLEALLQQADSAIPLPSYESLGRTLSDFLLLSVKAINEGAGVHLRFLMAQAQKDDDFRERFRENFVSRRRAVLFSILNEAVTQGEICPEYDLDILVDLVFGATWYRLLVGHAVLDEKFADELTRTVLGIAGSRP